MQRSSRLACRALATIILLGGVALFAGCRAPGHVHRVLATDALLMEIAEADAVCHVVVDLAARTPHDDRRWWGLMQETVELRVALSKLMVARVQVMFEDHPGAIDRFLEEIETDREVLREKTRALREAALEQIVSETAETALLN